MSLAPTFISLDVNLPAVGIAPQTFNTGLIICGSSVISTTTRVQTYTSLAAMVTDGFATNSAEY